MLSAKDSPFVYNKGSAPVSLSFVLLVDPAQTQRHPPSDGPARWRGAPVPLTEAWVVSVTSPG